MTRVEAVAGAGDVEIAARVARLETVVDRVVESAEAERRAGMVALARMVVDHVEDHFQAGRVQRAHHALELADGAGRRITAVRREEANGVVPPVVAKPMLQEPPLIDERVHRQELDRRDAEALQVFDGRAAGEAGVGAAQLLGHFRMALGKALDVQLIDHRVLPWRARRTIVAPAERRIDDLAATESRGNLAADEMRVRIEQILARIEAMAAIGIVRPVYAVGVEKPRARVRQVAMPDEVGALAQLHALDLAPATRIEQAELDALGVLGEEREVHSRTVPGGAERMRPSAPDGARSDEISCGRLHWRLEAYVGTVFAGCARWQPFARQLPSFCRCIA